MAALVAGVAVAVTPSGALACNSGTSAVNVYRECLPTGGGGKPTGGGSSQSGGSTTTSVPVSSQAAKVLSHTPAKDRRFLANVVRTSPAKLQVTPDQAAPAAPSAIGSAFDLGSGPTALLVALLSAAVLLLAGTGVRGFRQRRR
jgi:hypothetical protein